MQTVDFSHLLANPILLTFVILGILNENNNFLIFEELLLGRKEIQGTLWLVVGG